MKAITYKRYGGPEVLKLVDIEKPKIKPDQVLVKVHSSSLNSADYRLMSATPFLTRLYSGLFRPQKAPVLGSDVSGTVEQVGADVVNFKVGDKILADAFKDYLGAFAEYVCITEKYLVHKPDNLNFKDAATVPLAGVTALQGVRDAAKVKPGDDVLIQGAGGGVGFFIVQLVKEFGAKVTAVCGPKSMELIESCNPDRIINYQEQDFTREGMLYDTIIGVNGYHTLRDYKRCLKPKGRYVMIGGEGRGFFDALILGKISFLGSQKMLKILTIDDARRTADLEKIVEMLLTGKLRCNIDRTYPLEQIPDAMRYMKNGHVNGKIVIEIST